MAMFKSSSKLEVQTFSIIFSLVALCPAFFFIWLAVDTKEGRNQLGLCVGFAAFHLVMSPVVYFFFMCNTSIEKDLDVEAQLDGEDLEDVRVQREEEVQDVMKGISFSIYTRMGWG